MKTGDRVKILDIGPLATIVNVRRNEIEVEFEGETFWILKRFCERVKG